MPARIATLWLLATCAGCWEKIEYKGTPKPPAVQAAATTASPPENGGQGGEAATDVKSKAAAVEPASTIGAEVATTPTPPETATGPMVPSASDASAPPSDDRYAVAATPSSDKPLDSPAVPPAANGGTPSPDVTATTSSGGDAAAPTAAAEPTVPPSTNSAAPSSDVGDRYATASTAGGAAPEASTATAPATTPSPTEATTVPAGAESPPTTSPPPPTAAATSESSAPRLSTRRAAWLLGSRLALAALAHDRGVAQDKVPIWFADAQTAAKLLGTSFGELPEPASVGDQKVPASRQVINYLLVNGQRMGHDLAKQHGVEDASLFEVALKSNILLLLYTPSGTAGESIAAAIAQAAPRAKLPTELWKPLVDTLGKKAPQTDVRAAVRKMHTEVDQYLVSAAGQGN